MKKAFFLRRHFVEYCRYEVTGANPSGWLLEKGKMKWSLRDFRPENLSIDAQSIVPMFCSSVLEDRPEYGPQMVNDGNLRTAWVPARPTGEFISILPCPREEIFGPLCTGRAATKSHNLKGLRIFSGCGRSPELFAANNRPKTIEIMRTRITLKDFYGWQYIEVPKEMKGSVNSIGYSLLLAAESGYFILRIIDVYPGSRYNNTYLTEVEPVFE